eukprot:TRINITY_DN14269_c0_g1_i2.p1 TRINITY_DN14269_c0_g1~~TRINITY_DN14269_c0_g1_i2.p1  ORF type:complete len:1324 (+),score=272.48 TRINITY_DN14269_c0_g1_i2:183-4154(+)
MSTISLQSFHGGHVMAYRDGHVGLSEDETSSDIHFFVVPHTDGYISLKSQHGAYLVASPSGRLVLWHRGHPEADDWEKFKLLYNSDKTVSLRSKIADKYVAAEHPSWGVLSADRDAIDDWEKFNVTVSHGDDTQIPHDKFFSELWGMHHFGGRDIDAVEAWKTFTGKFASQSLVVAVIDTGIDYTHPDLKDQMWVNPGEIPGNDIDDDGNGFVDDVHGADFANNDGDPMDDQLHGTHCAGTIAGRGNNSVGVAGVVWQGARLMALKFLSATGGGRVSDAVKAVDYAVAMGARLSSNSWGGGGSSSAMRVAIERAERAGMLFVAAAGNEGTDNDAIPHYPSNYATANLLSVASTTYKGDLSSFSCYGQETVDVAAPGSDIYSTVPGGGYASLSGTSMATPHVSGLAALVWLYRPQLSMLQVKEIILESTVKDVALLGSSVSNGRINARRALRLASQYEAPHPPIHAPQGIAFEDTDPKVGTLGGSVTITSAGIENDVEYYSVHFISAAGFLMDCVGRANATGERTLTVVLNNLTVPLFAKGLAAVSANSSAKADVSAAITTDIDDFGIPVSGPEGVTWGGDSDGRAGFVAGAIKVIRSSNENTVSHYNIYWRDNSSRGELLGTVPTANFRRPSCVGDCALLNQSSSHGVYHFHRGTYDNDELAVISFSGPARVTITTFNTEKHYDYLEVGGKQISGFDMDLPRTIEVPGGTQAITWSSDKTETRGGWTLELTQLSDFAEFVLPTMVPPAMEVEVLAAFGKTELPEPSFGELSDFNANTMAPSLAYTPHAVSFIDTNEQEGYVGGIVEIVPSSVGVDGVVTFYRVFFTDVAGHEVANASWTIEAPSNITTIMKLQVASMALPSRMVGRKVAGYVVARAGNAVGECSTEASAPLSDKIRMHPSDASFAGDHNPREHFVSGDLTILPAKNPTGITGYAVYLTNLSNRSMEGRLLGQVAASVYSRELVYRVTTEHEPQQGLLVVSVYGYEHMSEGLHVQIEDYYNASVASMDDQVPDYGYGSGYGGWGRWPQLEHSARLQTQFAELWLQKPSPAALTDVQVLFMAEDKLTSSIHKLLASVVVPGILRTAQDGQKFLPPSMLERGALAAGLAEVLPGVHRDQVRLLRGQALSGTAPKARAATSRGAAGRRLLERVERVLSASASLSVDFEVLPPADTTGDDQAEQAFLDRVEAQLISLSQGKAAAARLDSALLSQLRNAGAELPETIGLSVLVSEPKQMTARPSKGRTLATQAETELVSDAAEDEGLGAILAAVLSGTVCALAAAGAAVFVMAKGRIAALKQEQGRKDIIAGPAILQDVSVTVTPEGKE